jgi:hypothetical protein
MPETRAYPALSDPELIGLLYTEADRLPRAAVDEIIRRGVPAGARLAAILDDESQWTLAPPRQWVPVHASYILSAMQPPGALDVLLRALEKADRYGVDWITDPMPSMLASFGEGALEPLRRAATDRRVRPWVRFSVLEALHHLAAADASCREAVGGILRAVASDASEPREIRQWAAMDLLPFAREEDRGLLLGLAGRGGFDILYNPQDVDNALRGGSAARPPEFDWLGFYDEGRTPEPDLDPVFDPDEIFDVRGRP